MKINDANFLTWHKDGDNTPLPLEMDNCTYSSVVCISGDEIGFIINKHLGQPLSGSIAISVLDRAKTPLTTNISSLSDVNLLVDGDDRLYWGTIGVPSLAFGIYHFRITHGSNTYISSPVFNLTSSYVNRTAVFKFRHKFKKNGINYNHDDLVNFYQQHRLLSNFNGLEFQLTKDVIQDNDSALPREYNHKVEYQYKVNLLNLSFDEHQAAQDMVSCSELYINNKPMQTVGAYSANRLRKDGRSDGSFSVSDYNLRYNKRV